VTARISIRPLRASDQSKFLAAVRRSRALHKPWTSPPKTSAEFRTYLKRLAPPSNRGIAICRVDTGEIVGVVSITNIVLGRFRSAYLGYYALAGHERRGLMREGLDAVVSFAFRSLKLHRVEANIQPGNAASIALAKACGFSKEGYSPRYLKIGGRWRDHERWARIADQPRTTIKRRSVMSSIA
jgi:ribosomal-protein-alanine N-acetyltransferase